MCKCQFCDNPIEKFHGYSICKNCETVLFEETSIDECIKLINDYFELVNNKLLDEQTYLHSIDQKNEYKIELSKDEQELIAQLEEYHDIRVWFEHYISSGSNLNSKNIRKLTYRLINFSVWFSNYRWEK